MAYIYSINGHRITYSSASSMQAEVSSVRHPTRQFETAYSQV